LSQGKLWAAADPERRPTKRAKDELDLLRITDIYPKYLPLLPRALRALTSPMYMVLESNS